MPPKKIKPNEKCHCGSGKKHKRCCMHQQSGGTTTAAADSAVSSAPDGCAYRDLIPVAKQNVATTFIEDIDGYNTTLIEVMDELSLTASSTVTAAAAPASDIGGRCFHGSTFDHFPDGRAYRDIIRDFFAVTTKNFPDCTAAAEKFTANHHEYFTDSNFFRYIFALCTSWQLKTKRTPVEMKVLIVLTITVKYLYEPLMSGGQGEPDTDKMKRYIRAIMHEDDRGVINCLAKETKPYCNCMKDQKTEAKGMDKTGICLGCENIFPRKDMLKCSGCKFAMFCDDSCYDKHWPRHSKDCQDIQKNDEVLLNIYKSTTID